MHRSNIIEILVGFIILVGAISIGVITFNKLPYKNSSHGCYIVKASFKSVDGLDIGDDITISGVKVGTVTSISLDKEYQPVVTMCIQKNILLPSDSSASLSIYNLLGKKYVDIALGSNQDNIDAGGFIEYTNSDLNISTIISKLISSFIK